MASKIKVGKIKVKKSEQNKGKIYLDFVPKFW